MKQTKPMGPTADARMGWVRPALIIVCLLLSIPLLCFSEEYLDEFRVGPGETRTLSESSNSLIVGKLILGEDSTLRVPITSAPFLIIAEETIAGRGSSIDARGNDGQDSTVLGGSGSEGQSGLNLRLFLGNLASSGLQVFASGGSGGSGGQGPQGAPGSEASCLGSDATNGSPGGTGGNGGDGGDGGNIFAAISSDSTELNIFLISDAVAGGEGGSGGAGGPGGRGKERCGIWPYWKRGSGDNGAAGKNGARGMLGESGERTMCIVQDAKLQEALTTIHDQRAASVDVNYFYSVTQC